MKPVIKQGVDCATPLTSETVPALHSYGYDVAIRYLVPEKYSKYLSRAEAQILTDNKMLIGTVFETTGTTPKKGYPAGVQDALSALECAQNLGVPQDACIYFAVDYQPSSSQDMYNISNYFIGIKSVITTYKVGVYGCYDVVEWLQRQKICSCYWQCLAWSYGKISEFATLYQKTSGRVVGGVNVDINDIYENVGFWNYDKIVEVVETVSMIVNGVLTPIRTIPHDGENYVRLRDLADVSTDDKLTVTYDEVNGIVTINTK